MRNYIDSNYHAGEIRLWKSARKAKSTAVVVEAKSDELFFQKFFKTHTTFFAGYKAQLRLSDNPYFSHFEYHRML